MTIIYFISTFGHGSGGHFYSLRTTVEAVSQTNNCIVVNIGVNESPIVNSIKNVKIYNIRFNGISIFKLFRSLNKIIRIEKPEVLHAFDIFPFLRIISSFYKIPLINNKCGGPNPTGFFPIVRHLVVYSKENYDFFKNHKKYKNTKLYFLPNRITQSQGNKERIEKLRRSFNIEGQVILRISRIGAYYKKSIIQAINLCHQLNKDGLKATLLIIGLVQDEEILAELKRLANDNVKFINDDEFTINASELIGIADYVIGTGRGLMEAASQQKVLLSPLKDAKLPLLINEDTFEELFYSNFSERGVVDNYNADKNYQQILQIFKNKELASELQQFSSQIFEDYFNINNKISDYLDIYKTADLKKSFHPFNLIHHLLKSIYFFVKASKK